MKLHIEHSGVQSSSIEVTCAQASMFSYVFAASHLQMMTCAAVGPNTLKPSFYPLASLRSLIPTRLRPAPQLVVIQLHIFDMNPKGVVPARPVVLNGRGEQLAQR